jgi:hypothetical protein
MKIELKKLTDVLGEVFYFVKIDGVIRHCLRSLEEAQISYKEICVKATAPKTEVLEETEIFVEEE